MRKALFACLFLLVPTLCAGRTVHLDPNGTGDYPTIQAAVNDANHGDIIILYPGTYTGNGNRDIDYLGKAITIQSTDPNDWEIVAATVIDCNGTSEEKHRGFRFIGGEDTNSVISGLTIIDGNAPQEDVLGEIQYDGGGIFCLGSSPLIRHCRMIGNSSVRGGAIYFCLSNAIVQECNFSGNIAEYHGAAIYCRQSQTTISKCTFQSNSAIYYGGAIYSWQGRDDIRDCNMVSNHGGFGGGIATNEGETEIVDCTVMDNVGERGGGICCGSVSASQTNSPLVHRCFISGNSAPTRGGGINVGNNAIIKDCVVTNNHSVNGGGVGFLYNTSPIMTNSVIVGNGRSLGPTGGGGSGVSIQHGSRATVANCTIADNETDFYGGGIYVYISSPLVANCIIWNNRGCTALGKEIFVGGPSCYWTLLYSDLEGGLSNIRLGNGGYLPSAFGNIDIDPCFADPCSGDYHLESQAGRWDPNIEAWVQDYVTSRCIDAGNPGSSLGDELSTIPIDPNNEWSENLRIDMGAYGGTAEASMPPPGWTLLADLTNDGTVDFNDFVYQAADWQIIENEQPGDLNRDGRVTLADTALLVADWLSETTWH